MPIEMAIVVSVLMIAIVLGMIPARMVHGIPGRLFSADRNLR